MFGANPTRQRQHDPQDVLALQGEPFDTIQGEGPLAGTPATFIRLWGCHLQCWFCDTDFESAQIRTPTEALVARCEASVAPLVVLTGGEPMRQYLPVLCMLLLAKGKQVQIETAGSFWFEDSSLWQDVVRHPAFTIVVSPKTPAVHPELAKAAKAWKYIVSAEQQLDGLDGLPITNTQQQNGKQRRLARPPLDTAYDRIFLQPMDQYDPAKNIVNSKLCIELAMRYGYRVSTQLHKQWGLP